MALPAGRYGVTKNQLLKIKKLPMNTMKLIEELAEKYGLLGTAAFKNSTSVVTDSTDLVESGAVYDTLRDAEVVQGKNFLPNNATTQTVNGVTFTVNADGSVTANGTATDIIFYDICRGLNIKKGTILNGCPSDGSASTYELLVTSDNGSTVYATDAGEGAVINNDATDARVFIRVRNAVAVSNKVFYPMISTEGGDYKPYYTPLKDVVSNKCDNSVIAPVENQPTCQKAGGYAVGDHFIRDRAFCTCKQAISQGGSFTLNTNYTADTVADLCKFVTAGLQSSNGTITNSYAYLAGALISYMFRYTPSNDIPANTDIITGMKNPFVAYGNMAGALFFDTNNNVYRIKLSFASNTPRFTTLDAIPADTNLRGSITYICQL